MEFHGPFYPEEDSKDEAYYRRMTYGRGPRWIANPNPNRRGEFPFPNPDRGRGEPSSNKCQIKINIPSFNRNLDIKSFLDWVYVFKNFFNMAYVPEENISSSRCTSSKEEQTYSETNCKLQGDAKADYL